MKFFTISLILSFLFIWTSCQQSQKQDKHEKQIHELSEEEKKKYLEDGKTIAATTFATLSASLQKAMAKGNVAGAIEYCNLAAFPLVDSLSRVHQAAIRRTTFKPRNAVNAPNENEIAILEKYENQINLGSPLTPIVELINDTDVAFFAPIKINAFCLQCHGEVGKDISSDNYALIKEIYPNDEATGYVDGELRGMWSIVFKR